MQLKPYKKKLKRTAYEGLTSAIKILLASPVQDDDDKLLYAVLAEISAAGEKRLLDVRSEYTISFSPAQAMAIRLLATDYMHTDKVSHVGNLVHQISIEVHKTYQS